jgi:hypothetical protein
MPGLEQGAALAAAILFLLASNGLLMPRPLPCHQVSILMQPLALPNLAWDGCRLRGALPSSSPRQ